MSVVSGIGPYDQESRFCYLYNQYKLVRGADLWVYVKPSATLLYAIYIYIYRNREGVGNKLV